LAGGRRQEAVAVGRRQWQLARRQWQLAVAGGRSK